jgi:uncharacterized protein
MVNSLIFRNFATLFLLTNIFRLTSLSAANANELPVAKGFVNDYSGVFTQKQERILEDSLQRYFKKTGIQIGIAVESSLNGKDKFDRAMELARGWGVGKKGDNTGILIYIATTERKYHILVAQGMQGKLPDGLIGEMARNELVPFLKNDDYFGGCLSVITAMKNTIANDYKYAPSETPWYIEWMWIPDKWYTWAFTLTLVATIFSVWIWGIFPNLKQQKMLKNKLPLQ